MAPPINLEASQLKKEGFVWSTINHHAYQPLCLLTIVPITKLCLSQNHAYHKIIPMTIVPINHHAYQPLCLSTIVPIYHHTHTGDT